MAIYEYRCQEDGSFDFVAPMGTAPEELSCPGCGAVAMRMLLPPFVSRSQPSVRAAIERAERSATNPEVVSRLPARPPARLPRP